MTVTAFEETDEESAQPLVAAFMEPSGSACLITFAVSELATDSLGTVVLGIDSLIDDDGGVLTLMARFDTGGFTVATLAGVAPEIHSDVFVVFGDRAVFFELPLDVQLDSQPGASAFCIIGGVPHQVGVPVVILANA